MCYLFFISNFEPSQGICWYPQFSPCSRGIAHSHASQEQLYSLDAQNTEWTKLLLPITVSDSNNNCWHRWTAHCSQQAYQRSHILISRTMENHISHHPIHPDTLDCFLFLLCHICLQLVGHATVSLVTLFSTLDASLHATQAHFVGHEKKKRPGFSHMKQYKLPMPRDSDGELPTIRANLLSSPTFTAF